MVRVFVFLAAVQVVLVALALISCLSAERNRIRALPRPLWVLVILLLPLIGAVAWFLAGRPRGQAPGPGGWPSASGPGPRPKPSSPDDDPDFLRSLDADQARRDRELFQRWEDDLKRREDELRDPPDGGTPQDGPRRRQAAPEGKARHEAPPDETSPGDGRPPA
jgi:hypothetical protein